MKMRMLKLYIACVLVFVFAVFHTMPACAAVGRDKFLEDGFNLLTRAEKYYRAIIYIDLKAQYDLMSSKYRSAVSFSRFKKTFGEALPVPPKVSSPEVKRPMHISGKLMPKSPPTSHGTKHKKNKKNGLKKPLPPSLVSNRLLYLFKRVKFLNKDNAIVYFDKTIYYKMPIHIPRMPPYIERTREDSDFWVKVSGKWYRDVRVTSVSVSGSKFEIPLKEGAKRFGGTLRTVDNIVRYKLERLARLKFAESDAKDTLKKLMLLAPLAVHASLKKRGVDSFVGVVEEGLDSRLEYIGFSLKRLPTSTTLIKMAAEVKRALGNKSDALKGYLKSSLLEKNNLKTIANISDLYLEKEDYKKSLEYMDKYLTLNAKVRGSRAKPKMQIWLESRKEAREKVAKLMDSIGRQGTEDMLVEFIHKHEWYTASEIIRKLYEYEGFRIQDKINAALAKHGGRPRIIPMKVSELIPGNMLGILRRVSIFELSRMLRFFAYGMYWTAAPIGTTGVDAPVNIMVRSAGYFLYKNRIYGKYDNIIIGRKDVSPHLIGYNVVVLDEVSGKVLQKKNFDTANGEGSADALAVFIAEIKDGRIVVVSTMEEASGHLNKKAVDAMYSIGGGGSLLGKFRWAHAVIGVKGAKPGTALEMLSLSPANATLYKRNSPYTFKELMEDDGKVLKRIKRETVFISDIQPNSTLLLAFP